MSTKNNIFDINELIERYEEQNNLLRWHVEEQLSHREELISIENKIVAINEERLAIEKRNEAFGEVIDKILVLGDKRDKVILLSFTNLGELFEHTRFYEDFIRIAEQIPRRHLNDACMRIMRELKCYVDSNKEIIGAEKYKLLIEHSEIREKFKNFSFDQYFATIQTNLSVLIKKANWDLYSNYLNRNLIVKKIVIKLDVFNKKFFVISGVVASTIFYIEKKNLLGFKILTFFYVFKFLVKIILYVIDNKLIHKTIYKMAEEKIFSAEDLGKLFFSCADFSTHFLNIGSVENFLSKVKSHQSEVLNYWYSELNKLIILKKTIHEGVDIRNETLPHNYDSIVLNKLEKLNN